MNEGLRPGGRAQSSIFSRPVLNRPSSGRPLVWGTSHLAAAHPVPVRAMRAPPTVARASSFNTRQTPETLSEGLPRGNIRSLLNARKGGAGFYKGLGSGSLMSTISKPDPPRKNRLVQAVLESREIGELPSNDLPSQDAPGSPIHEVVPPLIIPVLAETAPEDSIPFCIEIELASTSSSTSSTKSKLFSLDGVDLGNTLTVPTGNLSRYQSFILGRSFTNIRQTKEVECGLCSVSGYEIINQYIVLDECIGKGASGEVAMVVDSSTNIQYALKTISRSRLMSRLEASPDDTPPGSISCVKSTDGLLAVGTPVAHRVRSMELGYGTNREVAIMKKARHPNLVRLHEVIDDPHHGKLYLIMELLDKPVCTDFSMSKGTCTPTDPELLKRYLYEVLSGLLFLHRNNIVHRDLKPDNMMLNRKGEVVLIDFGVSEVADDTTIVSGFAGTPAFIAPEVWNDSHMLGPATDVWSLGVCFYMLLVGRTPFTGEDKQEMLEAITNNTVEFPPDTPQEWQECISSMLVKDPAQRSSVEACRSLPMLQPFGVAKRAEVAEKRKSGDSPNLLPDQVSPSRYTVSDDVTPEDVQIAVSLRCASLTDDSEAARRYMMRRASSNNMRAP